MILIRSFSNLLVTRTCIILWMSSNFGQIGPPTTELAVLECLRNTPIYLIMGKMVFPLFLLFLIGSFWYFHVTRTSIKAWMSLNFFKWDLTLAPWTPVSDRCPLGYLFFFSNCLMLVFAGGIGCKSDEFEYNTGDGLKCLKVLPDSFYTYEDAQSSCSAEGGHLVMEKDTVSSQLLESLSLTL